MNRRTYLTGVATVAASTVAGCLGGGNGNGSGGSGGGGGGQGKLVVRVEEVDGAIGEFAALELAVKTVGIKPRNGSGGVLYAGKTVDLTKLTGGNSAVVLADGLYDSTDSYVSLEGSVKEAKLKDGGAATVHVGKSLEFDTTYKVKSGTRTVFTAPVTVTKTGDATYALEADGKQASVSYE